MKQMKLPEPAKILTAAEIQQQIKNIINHANEDIKEIQISKSSGLLTQEFRAKLIEQMRHNNNALSKLEKLSKNPFLHNDFLYNRLMRSAINYCQRSLPREEAILKDKIEWIESQYFHWLTKLIKILQQFQSNDVVQMKQEVANIFNWYQNFSKYLEGMKLLEYPSFYKKGRKKSTEIMEIDKMSSSALTAKKERSAQHRSSSDTSNMGGPGGDTSSINSKMFSFAVISVSGIKQTIHIDNPFNSNTENKNNNKKDDEEIENPFPVKKPSKKDISSANVNNNNNNTNNQASKNSFKKVSKNFINFDILTPSQENRLLPKLEKKEISLEKTKSEKHLSSQQLRKPQNTSGNLLVLPNFRNDHQEISDQPKSQDSFDASNSDDDSGKQSSVSSSEDDINSDLINRPMDLRKKYLIEAPLSFKMNPPPKMVDLTSDFIEKDNDQVLSNTMTSNKFPQSQPQSPHRINKPKPRQIINNPKQNGIMVEVGKKKISQLKNFHGKMISEVLMRDFEVLFAPLDEMNDMSDYQDPSDMYMNKYLNGSKKGQQNSSGLSPQVVLNQTQGVIPAGFVHDDMLLTNIRQGQDARNGAFEFKASGIGMIKRTAQDDYRFQQLNEIQNLKNLLVKKGININHKILQRAILMPEDVVFDQDQKHYPTPDHGLMDNPFPKVRGTKKKKKKKKRRPETTSIEQKHRLQ